MGPMLDSGGVPAPAPVKGWAARCLPQPATHFTGRDAELARLASAVHLDDGLRRGGDDVGELIRELGEGAQ